MSFMVEQSDNLNPQFVFAQKGPQQPSTPQQLRRVVHRGFKLAAQLNHIVGMPGNVHLIFQPDEGDKVIPGWVCFSIKHSRL